MTVRNTPAIRPVVSLIGISVVACGIVYAVHKQQTDEKQVSFLSPALCKHPALHDTIRALQRMKEGLERDAILYENKLKQFGHER